MAVIVRNPAVDDHIREVAVDTDDGVSRARKFYEDGDIVLLKSVRLNLDYEFLNKLDFDCDGPPEVLRKVKKFTDRKVLDLDPLSGNEIDKFVYEQVFRSDPGQLRAFKEQVQSGNAQIEAIYRRLFPRYRTTKQVNTWRFTTTLFENLHWDNFHSEDDFHQVRIFANIDAAPRIWRVSHKIDAFARRAYAAKKLGVWRDATPDQFNFRVNNNILGGMERRLMDGLDLHHIAFEQGDVWLAETRIASHQIYAGRKAIASMFYVDPSTMDEPEKRFNRRIERLHADAAISAFSDH